MEFAFGIAIEQPVKAEIVMAAFAVIVIGFVQTGHGLVVTVAAVVERPRPFAERNGIVDGVIAAAPLF